MSHNPFIRRVHPLISHRRPDINNKIKWWPNWYPTTPVDKLMPALDKSVHVPRRPIKIQGMFEKGPDARLLLIGERVTRLVKYERMELTKVQALETRMYMERLLIQALRYGDRHRYTMECADFYLHEKSLVHKLFKVLVPRYANYTTAFTSIYFLAPNYSLAANEKVKWQDRVATRSGPYPANYSRYAFTERGVLELKGNPLPPLRPPVPKNANLLTNVLMAAAREDAYRRMQAEQEDNENGEEGEGFNYSDPASGVLLPHSAIDPMASADSMPADSK